MDTSSHVRLIVTDEGYQQLRDDDDRLERPLQTKGRRNSGKLVAIRIYCLLLHLVAFTTAFLLWNSRIWKVDCIPTKGQTWSPILPYVEYEVNQQHALGHNNHTPYSGIPSAEQDGAWDRLVAPMYFNASSEDLVKAGESLEDVAELNDGGHPASLGVYHELHCLRQLRFFLYSEKYYQNLTVAQENYLRGHLDHCIEALRLTIMCYGNTAVYSFAWDGQSTHKPSVRSNSKSICVKWSTVEQWSLSRMIAPNFSSIRRPERNRIDARGEFY